MLKILIEKEFKAVLLSPRFLGIFAVASVLILLSIGVGIRCRVGCERAVGNRVAGGIAAQNVDGAAPFLGRTVGEGESQYFAGPDVLFSQQPGHTGGQNRAYLKLVFGKSSRAVDAFTEVYEKLAYG